MKKPCFPLAIRSPPAYCLPDMYFHMYLSSLTGLAPLRPDQHDLAEYRPSIPTLLQEIP